MYNRIHIIHAKELSSNTLLKHTYFKLNEHHNCILQRIPDILVKRMTSADKWQLDKDESANAGLNQVFLFLWLLCGNDHDQN